MMATSGPTIAVINLPGLTSVLRAAGFMCMDGDAKTITVNVRELPTTTPPSYIIIIGISDPAMRTWVQLQNTAGVPVLIANSTHFTSGIGVPKPARVVDLPCTVNEIMAHFGAPPIINGDTVINEDGTSGAGINTNDANPIGDDITNDDVALLDDFDVFSGHQPSAFADVVKRPATQSAFTTQPDEVEPKIFETVTGIAPTPATPRRSAFADEEQPVTSSYRPRVSDDVFASEREVKRPTQLGRVVFVFAGKGGVGKSTTAISLTERAATIVPNLRSIAVDATDQGDLRIFLKLKDAPLPSSYDAAISRTDDAYLDAIINPKRLAIHRPNRDPLHLAVILAPEGDQVDANTMNPSVFTKLINTARTKAQLVVVDTQTIAGLDASGLIDGVVIPMLRDGAWGLGISDSSTSSADHLIDILARFVDDGVAPNRLMMMFNRVAPGTALDTDAMTKYVARNATMMGTVREDPTIQNGLNRGEIPGAPRSEPCPEYTAVLDKVLLRVTGLAAFAPSETTVPEKSHRLRGRQKARRS
jgi:cellulose biosynthesis protein BcsQ